ncbi:hypothetical protein [Leucobacter musarum]|uniref:hypothetical protein n=1 Tax=Leucobacter musarum TaxID=1930747 RepID=UPI0006A788C4|nr:hypothetical protein [Leucobacter musarum]
MQASQRTPQRIQLITDVPVCWEDPHTLRWGFERAVARLHSPSAGQQRFVSALRRGVDADRLNIEAMMVGATLTDARAVIDALAPVTVAVETVAVEPVTDGAEVQTPSADARKLQPSALRAVVCQGARPSPALKFGLLACGVRMIAESEGIDDSNWLRNPYAGVGGASDRKTAIAHADTAREADLAVIVERYWDPLARADRWAMRGIPHLLVRFTDRAVVVGPLIVAGRGPCHTCLTLHRVAADGATAALAAQLSASAVASERGDAAVLAAAHIADYVRRWLAHDPSVHLTQTRITSPEALHQASIDIETVSAHPECLCTTSPISATASRGRDAPREAISE